MQNINKNKMNLQTENRLVASRSSGWAWEELRFHYRDPEEESRGACFDISVIGNTP